MSVIFARDMNLWHSLPGLVDFLDEVYEDTVVLPLRRLTAMAVAYCYLGDDLPITPTL